MKGPDGLKVGQIVYTKPEISFFDDNPDAGIDDFDDSPTIVVGWPGGGLGYTSLDHSELRVIEKGGGLETRYEAAIGDARFAFAIIVRVTDDFEWYPTLREALLASADEEAEYARVCDARAAAARRVAGE